MKNFGLLLSRMILLVSSTTALAGPLWLDASCKVYCKGSKNLYPSQGGMVNGVRNFTFYLELEAMSREAIDRQTTSGLMNEYCQKNAESKNSDEKVTFEKIECLYFKH